MEVGRKSPWEGHPNGVRHWLRVLRPLEWWFLLVVVLYGLRFHEKLSATTRLAFSPTLSGKSLSRQEFTATLDGHSFTSGDRISIGWHKLRIANGKAEGYSTNLFVWYGEHDLGDIVLKRSLGTLSVELNPAANVLVVIGPEFSTSQSNSAGFNLPVPTDTYWVEARYRYSTERKQVLVASNSLASLRVVARLGASSIQCNQQQASFKLLKGTGQTVETGMLPITITELPEGRYTVLVEHRGNRRQTGFDIRLGVTNQTDVEFVYGSARIETDPPGAAVIGEDGRSRGVTPLTISELTIGALPVTLRLDGYEPVNVLLNIEKNEKTALRTNLISRGYTQAIAAAKNFIRSRNFEAARDAISDALRARPGDSEAGGLKVEADSGMHVNKAKDLGQQGDYTSAINELQVALQTSPDMAQAKVLLANYEKQQQQIKAAEEKKKNDALARKAAEERLHRPKQVMDAFSGKYLDAELFETKNMTCNRGIKEIGEAVRETMLKGKLFELVKFEWPETEVFTIDFKEKFLMGYRECLIVGGQTRANEAQIFYKVLEYEPHVDLGNLFTGNRGPKIIAVHPSRIPQMTADQESRLKEGLSLVTERIRQSCR